MLIAEGTLEKSVGKAQRHRQLRPVALQPSSGRQATRVDGSEVRTSKALAAASAG